MNLSAIRWLSVCYPFAILLLSFQCVSTNESDKLLGRCGGGVRKGRENILISGGYPGAICYKRIMDFWLQKITSICRKIEVLHIQEIGYETIRVHRSYVLRSFQCFSIINLIFFIHFRSTKQDFR